MFNDYQKIVYFSLFREMLAAPDDYKSAWASTFFLSETRLIRYRLFTYDNMFRILYDKVVLVPPIYCSKRDLVYSPKSKSWN